MDRTTVRTRNTHVAAERTLQITLDVREKGIKKKRGCFEGIRKLESRRLYQITSAELEM